MNETHVLAIESDGGTAEPFGIGFTGLASARSTLQEYAALLSSVGNMQVFEGGGGVDINVIFFFFCHPNLKISF